MDYRIIITMEFLNFVERCISDIISVFQIVLRGKQENPLSRGIANFAEGIFLMSGENLTRSDFEHLNLFQAWKQNSVNIEHQLAKIKISMTCVDKGYKFKIKLIQEQWLQLKMKSLLGSNVKII